jgi:hypothetical protein
MTTPFAATDKQIALIDRLSAERNVDLIDGPLTKSQASEAITWLLATPSTTRPQSFADNVITSAEATTAVVSATPVDVGMYRDAAGRIYKVQRSKTTEKLYAKELTPIGGERLTDDDSVVQFEFVYAPGAMRTLTSADRLSIADAKAFGIRYGVCCVCGRTLSDAKSVAAGIGPICARRL